MCGIVGLHIKNRDLRPNLGKWLLPMFDCMANRGADSAGLAVFVEPVNGKKRRFNLYATDCHYDWQKMNLALTNQLGQQTDIDGIENHATIISPVDPDDFRSWLARYDSALHLLSVGRSINVYKDTGHACDIAKRYGFDKLNASHCVGHTRMATEPTFP